METIPIYPVSPNRNLVLVLYILMALGYITAITPLVAIIIIYVKQAEVQYDAVDLSHFIWLKKTFWWSLFFSILGIFLTLIGIGVVVLIIIGVWAIYRLVRGFLCWLEHKPAPN